MPNSNQSRLDPQAGEAIDRSVPVEFEFDGRRVQGFRGDTVASALYAQGTRVFSRSFKYHRPRGLLCCSGNCPNCLVTVGDEPNVRACTRAVEPGLQVRSQNAWPSLRFDLLSLLDKLHWLMPVGFYYKALHRPKALWLLARRLIRRVGGLGSIDIDATHDTEYSSRNLHADVAVVGGGPAGMSAALSAAESGATVTLIDDQPTLGGHLRYNRQLRPHPNPPPEGEGMLGELAEQVAQSANIQTLSNATVFGLYQDNLLAVLTDDGLVRLRAKQVILATGAQESPLLFENNDLPGIMLASAARRLMALYGVRPGRNAVVATETPEGYETALQLLDAGVRVAAVVDASPSATGDAAESVRQRGVTVLTGHRVVKAVGRGQVKAAIISPNDGGGSRRIRCDLLCMSGQFQPVDALLHQMGASQPGVTLAGGVGGEPSVAPPYTPPGKNARAYVCFCEDVSAHDIEQAIDEGFADVQTLKRYSTVTMGPCQGKMCGHALAGLCAAHAGPRQAVTTSDTYTTSRPPYQPVSLAVLAGRERMPMKRSPMDRIHRELGATMVESGPWWRPHNYGSPADECAAVRERVGIIDVGTLGKLEVVGADAGQLLDRLYTPSLLRPARGPHSLRADDLRQRRHPGRRYCYPLGGRPLLRHHYVGQRGCYRRMVQLVERRGRQLRPRGQRYCRLRRGQRRWPQGPRDAGQAHRH